MKKHNFNEDDGEYRSYIKNVLIRSEHSVISRLKAQPHQNAMEYQFENILLLQKTQLHQRRIYKKAPLIQKYNINKK